MAPGACDAEGLMDGADFEDLLTGDLGSTLRWQPSMPCPCTSEIGAADQGCLVCSGRGRVYGEMSAAFRAGLVSQSARARAAMAQTMGPANVGDATVSIPCSAPCYASMAEGDRLFDQSVHDEQKVILLAGVSFALPVGVRWLRAWVRPSPDAVALVAVPPPPIGADRRVQVSVPTTLVFQAPRGYAVVRDLSQVRSFGVGLPKKWAVKLLDMSTR